MIVINLKGGLSLVDCPPAEEKGIKGKRDSLKGQSQQSWFQRTVPIKKLKKGTVLVVKFNNQPSLRLASCEFLT